MVPPIQPYRTKDRLDLVRHDALFLSFWFSIYFLCYVKSVLCLVPAVSILKSKNLKASLDFEKDGAWVGVCVWGGCGRRSILMVGHPDKLSPLSLFAGVCA